MAQLTATHFNRIARILDDARQIEGASITVDYMALALGSLLAETNRRFDLKRFMTAAGYAPEESE